MKYDITCPAPVLVRAGEVYKSFDNGKNWTVHNTGVDQTLLGIDCVNQYACWPSATRAHLEVRRTAGTSTRQQPGLRSG